ncbi:MAG: PAS domain-containing protein [Spirochaetia bacterium]|nr:PAS domain-containing protein [Spirochaetia bacterium]
MAAVTTKRSITYIRAVLTLLLFLLAAYNFPTMAEDMRFYIYIYLVVLLASNVVLIMTGDEKYEGTRLHYIIFIVDIIFLSLGTYWLADMDFNFFIIMFLTIFMCALSRSMALSIVIALVANVIYLYARYATGGGADILIQEKVLLNIPFLFVVALHSSFLAEKTADEEYQKNKLARSQKDLADRVKAIDSQMEYSAKFASDVYDAMPQGVIVLDSHGVVVAFNTAAEAVFNTKRNKVINILYREVGILGDVTGVITELIQIKSAIKGREIPAMIDNDPKKLKVSAAFVMGRERVPEGVLCTVEQQDTGKGEK